MRIQSKLFLLLLAIAIIPLLALSWRSERAIQALGDAIVDRGRDSVIQGIEGQLNQSIAYASDLLTAQQRQVEFALRLQASEAGRFLTAPAVSRDRNTKFYMAQDFDDPRTWPPDTELTLDYAITSPEGSYQAVPVSREHQAFLLTKGGNLATMRPVMLQLSGLSEVYRELNTTSAGLFYWQYVSLKSGLHSTYPGHGGYPAGYDPSERPWFKSALREGELIWTQPFIDAATRRLLLTAAMPVQTRPGNQVGVTGIDIDILKILEDIHDRVPLETDAEIYIVSVADTDGSSYVAGQSAGAASIRAVASSAYRDTGMAWDTTPETPLLLSDAETGASLVAEDLIAGRDGTRRMPHSGRPSLWVYGGLEQINAALLYIVPVDEIESAADQAQFAISGAIADQIQLAGIASITLIAVVAVLAMVASRSVTGPLRALATTARGLAGGNLDARANVKSGDEVGDLAKAFNSMIPQLRSHISVKESLALAREVQQKLLPETAPKIRGLDIAGRCVYSEDVGGDYYDFVPFRQRHGVERIGVVVGDVAGHGVVAALTMTSVRALLRSFAGDGRDLLSVIDALNDHLAADAAGGRFVTLVYFVIDANAKSMRWISAGHGPNLLYDPITKDFEELEVNDIPLGVQPDWKFNECILPKWPSGGILILGTDGIWETTDPEERAFGRAGLMEVVRQVAHLPAESICDKIVETLRLFSGAAVQRDDITLVVVKFLSD